MKKFLPLILVAVVLFSSGCALKEYYDACKGDPTGACQERAGKVGDNTETLVSTGVALIPHPLAPIAAKPAGKAIGYGFEFIAMLIFGRAILKKKKEEVVVAVAK